MDGNQPACLERSEPLGPDASTMKSAAKPVSPAWRTFFRNAPAWACTEALSAIRRFSKPSDPLYRASLTFGGELYVNRTEKTNSLVWAFGVWEPGITAIMQKCFVAGETFVDIGSHIGYYSVLASRYGCHVFAVEPSQKLFERLKLNLSANDVRGEIVPVAISDKKGRANFYGGEASNTGKASLLKDWTDHLDSFEVDVDTFDRFSAQFADIGMIKLDVEGAEAAVLSQVLSHLTAMPKLKAIFFEVNKRHIDDTLHCIREFVAQGFSLYAIENKYSAAFYKKSAYGFAPASADALPTQHYADYVLTKHDMSRLFPNGQAKLDPKAA